MRHLTPEILLDIAEGTCAEQETPHLATCPGCRQQLAEVRKTLETVFATADGPVPEPSPLFWDRLSERVRHGVAAGGAPQRRFWLGTWSWSTVVPAAAVAVVVIALVVSGPSRTPPPLEPATGAISFAELEAASDPSLDLVADLAADIDWTSGGDVGFVGEVGSADRIVDALSEDERQELQRLLNDALVKRGV